jgi:hypothetical protein
LKAKFLVCTLLISALGFGQVAVFNVKYPIVKFPKTKEGAKLNFIYEFTNDGKVPLEFYSFETECTCTEVELPKNPILPGDAGRINVNFDTNGKYYYQDRTIYLLTNTKKKREKLRFKVFVEPKAPNTN